MLIFAGMTSSARAGEVFPDVVAAQEPAADGAGGGGNHGNAEDNSGRRMEDDRSSSSSDGEDEERRKFVPPIINNPVIVSKLPFPKTNLSGVKGQFSTGTNPCDVPRFPANLPSAGKLAGQTDSVISSYNAVAALRKVDRVNPSLSGGGRPKVESSQIGSFKTIGDGRLAVSHFMTIVEKKQNISFSFDPKTLICSSCSGRGGAPCGGRGGGSKAGFCPFGPKLSFCPALQLG
jgi:hypothetical protein